jgi:hypothetical protein
VVEKDKVIEEREKREQSLLAVQVKDRGRLSSYLDSILRHHCRNRKTKEKKDTFKFDNQVLTNSSFGQKAAEEHVCLYLCFRRYIVDIHW